MHITPDPIRLEDFLRPADETCGASAFFVGTVRKEHGGRPVAELRYECYEPMADKEIARIVEEAKNEYPVRDVRAVHRVGLLRTGEVAVAVAVYSAHREEAFSACRRVVERIKAQVPIWKHERYADGSAEWVRP